MDITMAVIEEIKKIDSYSCPDKQIMYSITHSHFSVSPHD